MPNGIPRGTSAPEDGQNLRRRTPDPDRRARADHRGGSARTVGGVSQGWGFLILHSADEIARFREAVTPETDAEHWFAAQVRAPLIIVPHANKDAYLDRHAQPDKGFTDRSDTWWPAPYWYIDTGFASLLILLAAVDEGLGACFFGMPKERIDVYRRAFDVPEQFHPIGAISIGYSDEPPRDFSARRRPLSEVVHLGPLGRRVTLSRSP